MAWMSEDPNYISPQVKILKSIFLRGNSATTKEISQDTGMKLSEIRANARHLINHWTVRKSTEYNEEYRCRLSTWTIIPKRMEYALKRIKRAYPNMGI